MKIHLGIVLLCLSVSTNAIGHVSFWRKTFTLTCPANGLETIKWFKNDDGFHDDSQTYTADYGDTTKGHYRCEYNDGDGGEVVKYHFYVKGEVCENCYELNPVMVAVGIVADVLLTLAVILFVYVWTRRTKSAGAKPKKESSTGPSSGTTTASHYEALSPNSRSDAYSTVHRMG